MGRRYNGGYYDDYDGGYNARGYNGGYRYSNYYPDYTQGNYYPQGPAQAGYSPGAGAGASVGNFARIGGNPPSNFGSSSSFTSSNVNGVGVHSGSGVSVDPSGRVTSYQTGTGGRETIQTRVAGPGQVNGVYSSSSVNVGPDGKVTTTKDSGHF